MLKWEDYFRHSTLAETRTLAKTLDRDARHESEVLRRNIGDRHGDVLALAQRIESLKLLLVRQESDLSAFASGPSKEVSHEMATWGISGLGQDHITHIVAARLLSIIDRSIVQRKYVLAARALYLAQLYELPANVMAGAAEKLKKRLHSWMVDGTHVSQSILHAHMIASRWSAAAFVREFLALRLSEICKALADQGDMLNAFKLIDSTLFIHHQLLSDLCKSRLSQRRIAEMPEFSGDPTLSVYLKAHPQAGVARAFPPECYDDAGEPEDGSDFLRKVTTEVQRLAIQSFEAASDAKSLTEMLSSFVTQVQNSLSIGSGIDQLLDACEGPFSSQFEQCIRKDTLLVPNATTENILAWKTRINDLKADQAQVSRLSRVTKEIAPKFSNRLAALDMETQKQVKKMCEATYKQERARILGQEINTLEVSKLVVRSLALLDSTYASLGGAVLEAPKAQYEQLAQLIVERWKTESHPQRHEVSVSGTLFDLLLVMDAELEGATCTPETLEALRPRILAHIREELPEIAEAAEQALSQHGSDGANNVDRAYVDSRLLLQPLVQ